jgi:hypothetical protein
MCLQLLRTRVAGRHIPIALLRRTRDVHAGCALSTSPGHSVDLPFIHSLSEIRQRLILADVPQPRLVLRVTWFLRIISEPSLDLESFVAILATSMPNRNPNPLTPPGIY